MFAVTSAGYYSRVWCMFELATWCKEHEHDLHETLTLVSIEWTHMALPWKSSKVSEKDLDLLRNFTLDDAHALALVFKLLRTGMQWRELDCTVHYTTVLRKMHDWTRHGVFDAAYTRALRTHKRLSPPTH